jgi:hypothetical protein
MDVVVTLVQYLEWVSLVYVSVMPETVFVLLTVSLDSPLESMSVRPGTATLPTRELTTWAPSSRPRVSTSYSDPSLVLLVEWLRVVVTGKASAMILTLLVV